MSQMVNRDVRIHLTTSEANALADFLWRHHEELDGDESLLTLAWWVQPRKGEKDGKAGEERSAVLLPMMRAAMEKRREAA